ncbi:zinc finger protein 300-like isoform X2 [Adelges cooleyi]|uniref:zinc finger protein 300-like isoform X2 n=1 Tax=Adelges cooleyi TaxID=133065 RepID=UPI0021801246|nr:zinc finger protein 300-like isoform X2 [Adelges cooleyi]
MEKVPTIKIEEDETKYCFYSSMIEIVEDYTNIDYSNDIKPHYIENSYNCNLKAQDCPKKNAKKNKYSEIKTSYETKIKLKLDEDESIKPLNELIIKQENKDDISQSCFETEKKIIEVKVMKYDKYWFNTVIEVEEIVMLSSEHIDDYTNNTKPYDFHKSYNSSSSTLAQNVARDKIYEKPYSINAPIDEVIMPIETNGNYQKESLENIHIPTKSTDKVLNEAQSFVCNMCQKSFNARKQIIRHFEVSHNINPVVKNTLQKGKQNLPKSKTPTLKRGRIKRKNSRLLHECALCLKSFTTKSNLVLHERVHTGEKPYTCTLCLRSFSTKSNLVRHERLHSNGKTKANKCDICFKCFSTRYGLILHERIHTGEKPYTCSLCSKSFTVKSSLVIHERVHTGEKPYTCSLCLKSFSIKLLLMQHEHVHTGKKPYTCDVCSRSFTSKPYLEVHKLRHAGKYQYKCDICSMPVWSKTHLVAHRRIHTGEKPYKCDVCQKSFSLKSTLVSHKQVHFDEKLYTCDICQKACLSKNSLIMHKHLHDCVKCGLCWL